MKKMYNLMIAACFFYSGLHAQAGTPDPSFGDSGTVIIKVKQDANLYTAALQSDGKIIAGGSEIFFDLPGQPWETMLLRCNPDGSLDKTFGEKGFSYRLVEGRDAVITSMAIQNDGKILAVGYAGEYFYYDSIRNYIKLILMRYNKNGKPDYSFGDSGIAFIKIRKSNLYGSEVVIQPDGKILVAGSIQTYEVPGYHGAMFVARFKKNGQPDSSFYHSGHRTLYLGWYSEVGGMALCPDGKILIAGTSSAKQSGNAQYSIVKLTYSGEFDRGFGEDGRVITHLAEGYPQFVKCLALQADGKIILGADPYTQLIHSDLTLARFTSKGIIDSTFGNNGLANADFGYDERIHSLVIQPDGKIIAAGNSYLSFSAEKTFYVLARFNQSGTIDSSFNHNGKLKTIFNKKDRASAQKVILQPDGKVVAVGFATNKLDGKSVPVITRYLGDNPGIIVSAKQPAKIDPIKVFPNPATTLVQVTGLHKNMPTELIITDRMGNVLKKITTTNESFTWNIEDLRNGYYYLIIRNDNITHSILLLKK